MKDPRVEMITSPKWLYKLFEPLPSRFEIISRFGNTWISGPRGCGKSHYLRLLAFQPLAMVEEDNDADGTVDTWYYYEQGRVTTIKEDTNNDGKPDVWEEYDGSEALIKRSRDLDNDAAPDIEDTH